MAPLPKPSRAVPLSSCPVTSHLLQPHRGLLVSSWPRQMSSPQSVSLLSSLHAFSLVFQALQSNLRYSLLPRRLIISKRLAQCLHPALPSGVHLKALETYEIIFKIVGTKWLAKDLFLYRYESIPTFLLFYYPSNPYFSSQDEKTINKKIQRGVSVHHKAITEVTRAHLLEYVLPDFSLSRSVTCILPITCSGPAVHGDRLLTSEHLHHQCRWLAGCL